MLSTVFAFALLLQASDSGASTPPAPPPAVKAKDAKDPGEVICHSEPVIGSRLIKTKTCHTRAEWDQLSNNTRQQVENLQNVHGFPAAGSGR